MLLVFLLQGPSFCLRTANKGAPGLVLGLLALRGCALCSSLGVVALLGTSRELYRPILCQLDPLTAWPEYEIVKVGLGCGLALILELAFLTLLAVAVQRARPTAPPQRDGGSAHPAVVAVALTTFACRLPYNVTLLQRARMTLLGDTGSPRDELLLSLTELVLFGESCVNSLVTLFLHKPCRLALLALPGRLSRRCRREGGPAAASPSSE